MEHLPLVAKFVALPITFSIAGYNHAFSQNAVPILYSHPASISTPIFKNIYYNGLTHISPRAMAALAAFGYLAYNAHTSSNARGATKRNLYGSAAVLTAGIGLWTQLVMIPGINRVIEISKNPTLQSQAGVNEEAVELMKAWVTQNYFRGSLAFGAGVVGLYAALS